MAGGGGSQSSTVTNKLDPFTEKWRGELFGDAQKAYQQGALPFYPGSTVVPFSSQTQAGLDQLQGVAQGGAPNYGLAQDAASRSLSGFNPGMGYALNAAGGGLSNNPYAAMSAGAASTPTVQGMGALQGFANGGASNPYLDSVFNSMSGRVSDAVNANFARAGRSGPNAAHSGALTRELGNLASSIYMPAYENSQGRALSAAGQLAGIDQGDRSLALQGYGQAGSIYGQGLDRSLAGAGLVGDMWSQGNQDAARTQALLPSVYQYGMMPGQTMLDVGSIYEGQNQQQLAEDMSRYYYPQTSQWDLLNQYGNLVNGLPQLTSSTTTGAGTNRTMSGLGGALGGAQIGAMFGMPIVGAGIGGLMGLFG